MTTRSIKDLARALQKAEGIPFAEARRRVVQQMNDVIDKAEALGEPVLPSPLPSGYVLKGSPGGDVAVLDADGSFVAPLPHHRKHSPGGFGWGYTGSGAAELARCILIAVLGDEITRCGVCDGSGLVVEDTTYPCDHCEKGITLPPAAYQQFKDDVVAGWSQDEGWEMTAGEVIDWLNDHTLTVQQKQREDGVLPYPFFVQPGGLIGRQDFWRSNPRALVGFAPLDDDHTIEVSLGEFFADPQSAVGLQPVLADAKGNWATYPGRVESVRETGSASK